MIKEHKTCDYCKSIIHDIKEGDKPNKSISISGDREITLNLNFDKCRGSLHPRLDYCSVECLIKAFDKMEKGFMDEVLTFAKGKLEV